MSKDLVVLISGWKGAGKDVSTEHLVSAHNFKRIAFADPLKRYVSSQYGVPLHWFHDRYLKETPLLQYPIVDNDDFSANVHHYMAKEHGDSKGRQFHTPRSLCILEGSMKRSVDPNFWVKQAVLSMEGGGRSYAISDCRYRSEVAAVRAALPNTMKLITIRINREDTTTSTDPSERDLDSYQFDYVIQNKGSILDLQLAVDEILMRQEAR